MVEVIETPVEVGEKERGESVLLKLKFGKLILLMYIVGFRPNCLTCIAHLYLYYTLLVPHTYASYIRH